MKIVLDINGRKITNYLYKEVSLPHLFIILLSAVPSINLEYKQVSIRNESLLFIFNHFKQSRVFHDFITQVPPTSFSAPYLFDLGQPGKTAHCLSVLVSHVTKLHPGTRSVMCVVCVSLGTGPRVLCHVSTDRSHFDS